jgi:threonine/homoserine/homoserine lactone efflux protein
MNLRTTKLLFALSCLFVVAESTLSLSGVISLYSWWHRIASFLGGIALFYFTLRMLALEKQAKQANKKD